MRIFLWIVAIVSVLALALWISADRLAERGIGYFLGKRDIPIQSYRMVKFSREHIVLRDIALGENSEVKAKQLDLRVTWKGNRAATYDVTLTEADITAQLVDGRFRLGGVERLWDTAPAPKGEVTDMHLAGKITGHYSMGGAVKAGVANAVFTAMRDSVPLLLPLTLDGSAEGNLNHSITYTMKGVDAGKRVNASVAGSHNLAANAGKLTIDLKPVRFKPNGFSFAQMSPFYAEAMPTYPMRISVRSVLTLAKGSWEFEPVITFHELPLESLLGGVLGEDAKVQGMITGKVPLRISPDRWRISPARLGNKGSLRIAVSPVGRAADLVASHPQADIVLGALGNFQVEEMTLDAKSTDDKGGINFIWHFLGNNPELFGGKKVDFTLAVNANLEDIWISATQAESLAERAAGTKGTTP